MNNEKHLLSDIYDLLDKKTCQSFKRAIVLSRNNYIDIEELCLAILETDNEFTKSDFSSEYKLRLYLEKIITEKDAFLKNEYVVISNDIKNIINKIGVQNKITNKSIWKVLISSENNISSFIKENNLFKNSINSEFQNFYSDNENILITSPLELIEIVNNHAIPEKGTSLFLENIDYDNNLLLLDSREKNLRSIMEMISSKDYKNILIKGKKGIGKTSLIKQLNFLNNDSMRKIRDFELKRFNYLDIYDFLKDKNTLNQKIKIIINKLEERPNLILFFEDIYYSKLEILTKFFNSKVKIIAEISEDEYKLFLEKEKFLINQFNILEINELSINDTRIILNFLKKGFSEYYKIRISDESIEDILTISETIKNNYYPKKSIELLNRSCLKAFFDNSYTINSLHIKEALLDLRNQI